MEHPVDVRLKLSRLRHFDWCLYRLAMLEFRILRHHVIDQLTVLCFDLEEVPHDLGMDLPAVPLNDPGAEVVFDNTFEERPEVTAD